MNDLHLCMLHFKHLLILTNHCGLQVYVYRTWNVPARAAVVEERAEWTIPRVFSFRTTQRDAVRTDPVFETEELPAGISCLNTCLAHMDGDALSLCRTKKKDTYYIINARIHILVKIHSLGFKKKIK